MIDAHCHLYEFEDPTIFKDIYILTVAENYETSIKNIQLAKSMKNVFASIGIHPWNVHKANKRDLDLIHELAKDENVKCIGEVGLDRRYGKASFDKQLEIFETFMRLSKEYSLPMNVHCLDAWEIALDIVLKFDVPNVLFHWYTGPIKLLDTISSIGYYVSINPSVNIQPRHKKVIEIIDIECILTESDGPYNYRGLILEPPMVRDTIKLIAELRNLSEENVMVKVYENFKDFLNLR